MEGCFMLRTALVIVLAGSAICTQAEAQIVNIQVNGVVDFNVIRGNQEGIPAGAPVVMSFNVDADNFVDSMNFPTRGYVVDLASFSMTVGGQPITIDDPQPFGDAYFVLRNNDPAVDGFLLSRNVDVPQPVGVHIPGLSAAHDLDFLRTFNDGTALASLDILDAVGSYDLTNLSVYNWTIGRFGNPGAAYAYESMTISVVPAPSMLALLGGGAMIGLRRRR
jgi:hypothetical protein